MVYNSLFDDIAKRWDFEELREDPLLYKGSVEKIIKELYIVLNKKPEEEGDFVKRIMHPVRIIRAILENQISTKKSNLKLLSESIDFTKTVYSKQITVYKLKNLEKNLKQAKIYGNEIIQESDFMSWKWGSPYVSEMTSAILAKEYPRGLLIIALANGAIAPGIDVFLRYTNKTENKDALFYPVRFSKTKKEDQKPHLRPEEIDYLKKEAYGKNILIFDEDAVSRKTIEKASKYFKKLFCKNINFIVNSDVKYLKANALTQVY